MSITSGFQVGSSVRVQGLGFRVSAFCRLSGCLSPACNKARVIGSSSLSTLRCLMLYYNILYYAILSYVIGMSQFTILHYVKPYTLEPKTAQDVGLTVDLEFNYGLGVWCFDWLRLQGGWSEFGSIQQSNDVERMQPELHGTQTKHLICFRFRTSLSPSEFLLLKAEA